ncbi:hypothetical protein [Rhodococcus koreensis]|uniref:hypothetical protein n=1 Tax=Rhodococcus koreensis TaxID=99653 RepID=UPI00366C1146
MKKPPRLWRAHRRFRVVGGVEGDRDVCASGGYAIGAAQQELRFRAVATVSIFNMGRVDRQELGDPNELLAAVGGRTTSVANGVDVQYLSPLPAQVDGETPPVDEELPRLLHHPAGTTSEEHQPLYTGGAA